MLSLDAAAKQSMIEHGFQPDLPPDVLSQLEHLAPEAGHPRDLRHLLWSSIDNDTSRDLDQIEVCELLDNGAVRLWMGIADVVAFIPKDSAIDRYAAAEGTSVYTGVRTFPMLPEKLSTDLTSLLEGADKLCVVTEMVFEQDGGIQSSSIYPALVRNRAQLTYNAVGPWLEGKANAPAQVAASAELEKQLRIQNDLAHRLRACRFSHGALNIDSVESRPVVDKGAIVNLAPVQKNRATELIEDFMIATNSVMAQTLAARKVSSIRRVVKTPERWNRIVELAGQYGETLPAEPDSGALNAFLLKRKAADPLHSADLSLAVVKLMGPGEYVLERPGDPQEGHFGLAVRDYTHSTAPNRRFADLVTQRIVKALDSTPPYPDEELAAIARHCTLREDAARKVERVMTKRIAASVLQHRIGERFSAIVTGVTPKGTFVRVLTPHAEGRLIRGEAGVDVGDKVEVTLVGTDIDRGFIDFAR
ncbi:MAG: RNB domain-containing ribonuclease [Bryobacteraceae bacterium]